MNNFKVWLLMGLISVLLVWMGSFFGGRSGATLFFLIALGMNGISYFFSDKIAIKMTRSVPVSRQEAPELYYSMERLCRQAELPMPKLYIQPSHQPNAFATGRNPQNASVAVTEGLLRLLNQQELEGVLAHELAHIKNRDILIGAIAATMASAITMIADIIRWGAIFGFGRSDDEEGAMGGLGALAMAFIAPFAAMIIQFAISRQREFLADSTGAKIAGNPHGLASALVRLEEASHRMHPMAVSPAMSHMYIANPLSGRGLMNLFSTHPSIAERVRRLQDMH